MSLSTAPFLSAAQAQSATVVWVVDSVLPAQPVVINNFDPNTQQIGIRGIYRYDATGQPVRYVNSLGQDVRVTKQGADTLISVVTSPTNVPFQDPQEKTVPVAILKNTDPGLISPLYVLNKFYDGVNQFVASFTDADPSNDGDFSGIKAVLDPNVIWELGGPTDKLSWSGKLVGADSVESFFTQIGSQVLFQAFRREGAVVQGNVVASLAAERTLVYGTNQVYVTGALDLFQSKNGKISHGTIVIDTFPIVQTYQGGSTPGQRSPFTIDGDPSNQFEPDLTEWTGITQTNPIVFGNPPIFNGETLAKRYYAALYNTLATGVPNRLNLLLSPTVSLFTYGPKDITPSSGQRDGRLQVNQYLNNLRSSLQLNSFVPRFSLVDGFQTVVASSYAEQAKVVQYDSTGKLVPVIDPATSIQKLSPSYNNIQAQLFNFTPAGQIASTKVYYDSFPRVQARLGGRPFTVQSVQGLGYSVPPDLQDFLAAP